MANNPPEIQGLGSVGGFQFYLEDQRGNQTPGLQEVFSTFAANAPKMRIEVDRDRAEAL